MGKDRDIQIDFPVPPVAGGSGEFDFKPAEVVGGRVILNVITEPIRIAIVRATVDSMHGESRTLRRRGINF